MPFLRHHHAQETTGMPCRVLKVFDNKPEMIANARPVFVKNNRLICQVIKTKPCHIPLTDLP